jgi:pimeloyl-ACP methyl ester carboxylesterase
MGEYADLPGVRTWYEVEGAGDPLLLLHGAFGSNDRWTPQRQELAARYRVFLPERRAHGHTPDVEGPLSYHDMARDTIDFLKLVVAGPAHLVGWSDGANVGLLVAIAVPELVRKLVVIGANFLPAAELPETRDVLDGFTPDSPDLVHLRAAYGAVSPDGPAHWPVVVTKAVEMFRREPNIALDDLARIRARTLVMTGDDDMFSLEHTIALYRAIPNSELAVVPGTSHTLLREKPDVANRLILDFLANDPVPTFMPVRRAAVAEPR